MKKAIWIWENAAIHADEYAKFYDRFAYNGEGTVTLQISCDTNYECYVNGTLAALDSIPIIRTIRSLTRWISRLFVKKEKIRSASSFGISALILRRIVRAFPR